jgi:AcrR family transcriptional regulator
VPRRRPVDPAAAGDAEDRLAPAATVVRRAPFSDNPAVGARGQRTRQRILDAALQVFGEDGYRLCSIHRITKVAGCSRISFYQYFSGKEDVFRRLAVQVARQLDASVDRLDPVTPDATGWDALRAWVGRHAEIYDRYQPVFHGHQAAVESDELLAGETIRTGRRYVAGIRSRLSPTELAPRELDPVIELLLECVERTFEDAGTLRAAAPDAYPAARMEDALADVMHRTFFGLQQDVNVHGRSGRRLPRLPFGPVMSDTLGLDAEPGGGPAYETLLEAGRKVFISRGYHGTRVDDIVAEAGVSHGAFYRYFRNKDQLAHLLAARAVQNVSTALVEIPDVAHDDTAGSVALRRWLRLYNRAQADEAGMIRVWVDAALQDTSLLDDSAPVLDWGRRRMARFLRPRGFGDPETEAVVMLALVDALGVRTRPAATIDAAVHIIERGFLGR